MEIHARNEGGITVVAVSGRLDTVTTPEYETTIRDLVDHGATRLVLDLERLLYISSSGLRGLLITAKLLQERNGQVCVANVKGDVRSVFEMCRLNDMFRLQDSVAAAIAALENS